MSISIKKRLLNFDNQSVRFIISDGELTNPPLRPQLFLKSSIEYKIRKTVFTTQFGILIVN